MQAAGAEPGTGGLVYLWTRMPVGGTSSPVPGLLAGTKFGTEYELYYFFPLTAEQQTIASIQRTLLLVGLAAVFLLAAIAWLVTRWVVVPVRPPRMRDPHRSMACGQGTRNLVLRQT